MCLKANLGRMQLTFCKLIILTLKKLLPLLRNSVTPFLHLSQIFPPRELAILKQAVKVSLFNVYQRQSFGRLTLIFCHKQHTYNPLNLPELRGTREESQFEFPAPS